MATVADSMNKVFSYKHFHIIACCVIIALTLVAYGNTFNAAFHFDDNPSIIENSTIRHASLENIMKILQANRPVVYLSIMLNYQLHEINVVGYHVLNITVHILNGIMVYFLVLWTLNLPQFAAAYAGRSRRMALFCALLFVVHPVQTESVTYIISRTELLATCFYLAAFLFFIRAAQTGRLSSMVGLFFSALLSAGSKEWAVTLPALLALYDLLFLADRKIGKVLSRWYLYVITAVPTWALVVSNLDLFSHGGSAGVGFNLTSATGITPVTYLYTSLNVIWTYIRLLLLPINQNLDYDYAVAKTLFEFPTLLSFAGHVLVIAFACWGFIRKQWTLLPFAVAWFYIGLSPTQSFVPVVDVIFEHRVYMPSIGFFLFFVLVYESVFDWAAKKMNRPAAG